MTNVLVNAAIAALEEWKRIRKTPLNSKEVSVLDEWKRVRNKSTEKQLKLNPKNYPIGQFNNLESIRLRWLEPVIYDFIPKKGAPFSFTRANGQTIEPRRMFTDGGSIPRLVYWDAMLDPWRFAPAYFLHDWLFEQHHCNVVNGKEDIFSFKDTNDILMEGIVTMDATGLSKARITALWAIDVAINSIIAKRLWNAKTRICTLPPDFEE